jgi:hypothetical protein
MHIPASRAMRAVLLLLKTLIVLNLVFLPVFLLVLAGSFTELIIGQLREDFPKASLDGLLFGVRAALLIASLMVPLAHVLLTRLRDIVETVRAGDPFVSANAGRLTTIAWSLLGIQLLDLAFGITSYAAEPIFGWTFSLTGWLAVVLLFILARVFAHGTEMREELAGTV